MSEEKLGLKLSSDEPCSEGVAVLLQVSPAELIIREMSEEIFAQEHVVSKFLVVNKRKPI
jgi:hypothetical protein